MRASHIIGFLMATLVTPIPLQARWDTARDNKSPIELAGMTNEQLFNEAFDVCVRRALLEAPGSTTDDARQASAECDDYLNTVYPFVRERNGGKVPPWMSELVSAHTTKECQRAFRTFLAATERPADDKHEAPRPAQQHRPEAKRKTPARQPRSHWTEQLPPWLAPH
jgi:hypothetical protein